jgi:hypothetical protein
LLGRDAFVAGGAFQFHVPVGGCELRREPGIGWPPARVPTNAGHPLALAVAGGWWALPRKDRRPRQAGYVGRHGCLCPSEFRSEGHPGRWGPAPRLLFQGCRPSAD